MKLCAVSLLFGFVSFLVSCSGNDNKLKLSMEPISAGSADSSVASVTQEQEHGDNVAHVKEDSLAQQSSMANNPATPPNDAGVSQKASPNNGTENVSARFKYMEIEQCADYWAGVTDKKLFLTKEEALNFYGEQGWKLISMQPSDKGYRLLLEKTY